MTDQRVREIADIAFAKCSGDPTDTLREAICTAWREGMQEAAGICLHVGRDLYESGGLGVDCSQKCAAAIRERI